VRRWGDEKQHALFENDEDSTVIIRVTFNDREECVLLGIFCINVNHPTIPVGVEISGFNHPPCCPEYISRRD